MAYEMSHMGIAFSAGLLPVRPMKLNRESGAISTLETKFIVVSEARGAGVRI
jgi:hypothetical protein